jgi:hypothetical protein
MPRYAPHEQAARRAGAEPFGHLRFAALAAGKWCAESTLRGKI